MRLVFPGGIVMSADGNDFEAELRALLAQGGKIEAIKRYREQTGAGLAAAKEAVEALAQGESLPTEEPMDASTETEIVSLLKQGQKLQAVKLYRECTGVGLKEAKDAIELMAEKHGLSVATGGGCLGAVILILLLVVAGSYSAFAGHIFLDI
jgi:ribosomal protein L7/L12